jgi:hypothetical protein
MKTVLFIISVLFIGVFLVTNVKITYANEEIQQESAVEENAAQMEESETEKDVAEETRDNAITEEIVEYKGFLPDQAMEDEETIEIRGFKYE